MTVSIIIPVYNTEACLPACLDSILSQSFTDFEVLLVDDGSTDGSGAICDAYAARDGRVRVFHQENGGVSSARNAALENAAGAWVCFVDSDDQLCPGGLQALADGISDQVDLVMADYIETDHPVDGVGPVQGGRRTVAREEALASMFNDPARKFEGYVFAKLFRRDVILQKHLTFDPAIAIKEDTLFVVSYLCLCDGMVSVSDTPVYVYILRPSSAMGSLKGSYNPKYLTSFEAIVRMNRLVGAAFPGDRRLLSVSRDEVVDRVYRVLSHMSHHDAVDKGVLSRLKKRAIREVGIAHYWDYRFRRNAGKVIKRINRLFKTNNHV